MMEKVDVVHVPYKGGGPGLLAVVSNEVDMMIWRHDRIAATFFEPTDLRLDPGTYFWTISAIKDGEEIAASGLSAFVVRPSTP